MFPNQTNNETLYSVVEVSGTILKFVNGSYIQQYPPLIDVFGNGFAPDLYKIDSATTWAYWSSGNYVYRGNFSKLLELGGSDFSFYGTYPIGNASITSTSPTLTVALNTSNNGTLSFYVDGVLSGSYVVNSSSTIQTLYFTPPTALSIEYHYWYANYTLDLGYSWQTPNYEFIIEYIPNIFDNPGDAIALVIGGMFNLQNDLGSSQNISAILFSLIGSTGLVVLILSKAKHTKDIVNLWIVSFMALLLFFTIAGWFNPFLYVLILIIDAFIVVKSGMGIFGGG